MVAVVRTTAPAPAFAGGRPRRQRAALVAIDSHVVHPSRRRTVSTLTYRRRRVVAAAAVLVLVSLLALFLHGLVAGVGSGALTASGRPAAAEVYVVQPGDTFWSIARRLQPHGDPRLVVTRMVAVHGSPVLHAGERITLP